MRLAACILAQATGLRIPHLIPQPPRRRLFHRVLEDAPLGVHRASAPHHGQPRAATAHGPRPPHHHAEVILAIASARGATPDDGRLRRWRRLGDAGVNAFAVGCCRRTRGSPAADDHEQGVIDAAASCQEAAVPGVQTLEALVQRQLEGEFVAQVSPIVVLEHQVARVRRAPMLRALQVEALHDAAAARRQQVLLDDEALRLAAIEPRQLHLVETEDSRQHGALLGIQVLQVPVVHQTQQRGDLLLANGLHHALAVVGKEEELPRLRVRGKFDEGEVPRADATDVGLVVQTCVPSDLPEQLGRVFHEV
mmetsp:Transcript_15032/g.43409  ORF Transcript_15032/g.43409 Transcript_15032/m.43409 type:complete len:308 (-) Transcript_15032:1747-2670(-)